MKVLVVSFNDGDNLAIENVLYELESRGHEITIYARYQDENSIRMFKGLKAKIKSFQELSPEVAENFDIAFCSVNMMIHLKFLNVYTFVYSQYFKESFMTDGADFLFTYRNGATPRVNYHCASMQVGDPKNDHVSKNICQESNRILYIDTGHMPYGHKGKTQVADMILKMCNAFPNYEICIKPRWLRNGDLTFTHKNTEHLYTVIESRCNGCLPKNLNMLNEHKNLQDLIDSSISVVTLYSTVIADVVLRGKRLVVVSGWDNEDKWDARKEVEIKIQHDFFSKSGCVVDINDVNKYLPYGINAKQKFKDKLFCYTSDASKRMVDVMEYVHNNYLKKGIYPAAKVYNYENFQKEMRSDPNISMETLQQERVRDIVQQHIARFSYLISVPIDYSKYYDRLDKTYKKCPLNEKAFQKYFFTFEMLKYQILVENNDLLNSDAINQAFLFQAFFKLGQKHKIINFPVDKVLCTGPYNYYLGKIYEENENIAEAQHHYCKFLIEANSRSYDKYNEELDPYIRTAYSYILNTFDINNPNHINAIDFANLYIALYEQRQFTVATIGSRNRAHFFIPQLSNRIRGQEPELAYKCLRLYAQWDYIYKVKEKDIFIEKQKSQITKQTNQINQLNQDIDKIEKSKLYKIGSIFEYVTRKIKGGIRCLKENGIKYTYFHSIEKLEKLLDKKLQNRESYRIRKLFKTGVMNGYDLYCKFIEKYGDDSCLLLSAASHGDAFIFGHFFSQYAQRQYPGKTAVYGVFGNTGITVAKLFNIKNVESYSMDEFNKAWNPFLMFDTCNIANVQSMYFHTAMRHILILRYLEGIHGFNIFSESMVQLGFNEEDFNTLQRPSFDRENADIIFKENNLKKHKTVVLAPYAKTIKPIPIKFWEKLANELLKKGFVVCTNSVGKTEPPISKTTPVFVPFSSAAPFLENAGAVIGLRSGFLDVVSYADCLKISLHPIYDIKRSKLCNVYDYYALSDMFRQSNQFDYVYSSEKEEIIISEIIQKVIKYLK